MAAIKLRVQNLWIACYQDKISFLSQASKTNTFIDLDSNNNLFYSLLNVHSTPAEIIIELLDEYVKYITKNRNKDINNPLQ